MNYYGLDNICSFCNRSVFCLCLSQVLARRTSVGRLLSSSGVSRQAHSRPNRLRQPNSYSVLTSCRTINTTITPIHQPTLPSLALHSCQLPTLGCQPALECQTLYCHSDQLATLFSRRGVPTGSYLRLNNVGMAYMRAVIMWLEPSSSQWDAFARFVHIVGGSESSFCFPCCYISSCT